MKPSELMDDLFECPAISLGYESILRMQYFIGGYISALQDYNLETDDALYSGFSPWVCRKFDVLPMTKTWVSVCTFHSLNEQGAFELAQKLWEEYKVEMKESPVN